MERLVRLGVLILACRVAAACGGDPITSEKTCKQNNGGCHARATCSMENGLAVCECSQGFYGDGIRACDEMLVVTSPAEGAVFSLAAPGQLNVAGSTKGVTSVKFTIDGGEPQAASLSSGAFSTTVALKDEDGVSHTLEITADDGAGNTAKVTRKYLVDRVAPQIAIVSPAEDAACTATACRGAVVNLAMSTLSFEGTATDGGGLAAVNGVKASLDGMQLTSFVTPGAWTTTWRDLPAEDGLEHSFVVTATDAAGNSAAVARKVWVDRVAPKCSVPQNGKRLVARNAPLLSCSERMDVDSVIAAVSFVPPGIGSSDGKVFRYSDASALQPYTAYSMTVGPSAHDRAGNPLEAAVEQRFLTEAVLPAADATLPATANAIGFRNSRSILQVVTDLDGKPIILFLTGTTSTGLGATVARWDGRATWEFSPLPLTLPACSSGCAMRDLLDLRVNSSVDAELTLSSELEVLTQTLTSSTADAIYYLRSKELKSWAGLAGGSADRVANSQGFRRSSFVREYLTTAAVTSVLTYVDGGKQYAIVRRNLSGTAWEPAPTPLGLPSSPEGYLLEGCVASSRDSKRFVVVPTAVELPFTFVDPGTAHFGAAQQRTPTPGGFVASGSAFLLWAGQRSAVDGTLVAHLACSVAPDQAAQWKVGPDSVIDSALQGTPSSVSVSSGKEKTGLVLRKDEYAFFGSVEDLQCSAAKAPVWLKPVSGARAAAVAVGPDDVLWRAWIDEAGKVHLSH